MENDCMYFLKEHVYENIMRVLTSTQTLMNNIHTLIDILPLINF